MDDLPQPLLTRCEAVRQTSARLREQARALCELSTHQRQLMQWRPPATPTQKPPCDVCGELVESRDLVPGAARPTHAACRKRRARQVETAVVALLATDAAPCCRRCLADSLGTDLRAVYRATARLLARRSVRATAGACSKCGAPSLLMTVVALRNTDAVT